MTDTDARYGLDIWRTDETEAEAEARRRIAHVAETGADTLDLTDLISLTRLPDEIAALDNLQRLYCGIHRPNGWYTGNEKNLHDLKALANLRALHVLDLEETSVTDTTALSGLSSLVSLNLRETRVTDIGALSRLSSLQTLKLAGTDVTDVTALSGLVSLQSLDLYSTSVTDLTALLRIPAFAEERATFLDVQGTPAAKADPQLAELAMAPGEKQAKTVIQYLKVQAPEPQAEPPNPAPEIAARMAQVAPIRLRQEQGKLVVENPGPPERSDPVLPDRLKVLRRLADRVAARLAAKNMPKELIADLEGYRAVLAEEAPVHFSLDTEMSFLKGHATGLLSESLDEALLQPLRELIRQHDDLGPSLVRAIAEAEAPDLTDAATPQSGADAAGEMLDLTRDPALAGRFDESFLIALQLVHEVFLREQRGATPTPGMRRGAWAALSVMVGGTLGLLNNVAGIGTWIGIEGAPLLARLNGLWETITRALGFL